MIKQLSPYGGGIQVPDRIVIHAMGEEIDDGDNVYTAADWLEYLKLSAHYLVLPDGSVMQLREDNQTAFHARGYNTGSIGIETLVEGRHNYSTFIESIKTDWVKIDQYKGLIDLTKGIMDRWDISSSRVDRHSDLSPGRKLDPGEGFKWAWFKEQLL